MDQNQEWTLYYWPGLPGRGEYARLIFAETETPFLEPWLKEFKYPDSLEELKKKHNFRAVPVLKHNNFYLSQSTVITRYVAERVGNGILFPKTLENQFRAEELLLGAADLVEEGCRYWHAIDYNANYEDQKEETAPFIVYYRKKRLPPYIDFWEKSLKDAGGEYFIGNELSYIDLVIWFILEGNERVLPEDLKEFRDQGRMTYLDAFRQKISNLPRIKAWVDGRKSRNQDFSGNAPIF